MQFWPRVILNIQPLHERFICVCYVSLLVDNNSEFNFLGPKTITFFFSCKEFCVPLCSYISLHWDGMCCFVFPLFLMLSQGLHSVFFLYFCRVPWLSVCFFLPCIYRSPSPSNTCFFKGYFPLKVDAFSLCFYDLQIEAPGEKRVFSWIGGRERILLLHILSWFIIFSFNKYF